MLTTKRVATEDTTATVCEQKALTAVLGQVYDDLSQAHQNGNLTYNAALFHVVSQYGANGADAHNIIMDWVSNHDVQSESRRKRRRLFN